MLLLQSAGAVPTSAKDLILHASTATQVVLVILVVLSLVSWAIMLGVGRELTRALRSSTAFAREIERAGGLDSVGVSVKHATPSASHRLLVRAFQFIGSGATRTDQQGGEAIAQLSPTAAASSRVETLRLVMDAESLAERDRLGRFLPSLDRRTVE